MPRGSRRPASAQQQLPNQPISFKLSAAQRKAIDQVCGGRATKVCGYVVNGRVVITEITCLPPGYPPSNAVYMPPSG